MSNNEEDLKGIDEIIDILRPKGKGMRISSPNEASKSEKVEQNPTSTSVKDNKERLEWRTPEPKRSGARASPKSHRYKNSYSPRKSNSPGKPKIECKSVILLFDLNGTIICKTKTRKRRGIYVRPFVERLTLLKEKGFKLGIFSSATLKTVEKALEKLATAMGDTSIFEYILFRDHCDLAPHINGNQWDTVKPLSKNLRDIKRVVLFDDDEYKVLESEREQLVLVPAWDEDEKDRTLIKLVDSTLKHIESDTTDVRLGVAKVALDLLEYSKGGSEDKEGVDDISLEICKLSLANA